jgi:hypothetical protein
MAVLIITPYQQFFDSNGNPLNGGKVFTYDAGTLTPKATYSDNTESTPLANPVILDSAGRTVIWGTGTYKFIVKDSLDNTIQTTDNVAMYSANSGSVIPSANAAGTVDVITADYNPNITLTDKVLVAISSLGANASTTPTFAPDGNTARTIVKNGSSTLVAGDIGAAGSVHLLQYDLTNTRWQLLNPASTVETVSNKTAAYTALTSDSVLTCDATSAAFTVTLYTAVGNSGKKLTIKKIDASTNAVTIDANSTETIDGALTLRLSTQYESVTIQSNGTNWIVLARRNTTPWVSYTPTFTGFGTVTTISIQSRRVGDSLEVKGLFTSGTSTGVEAQMTLGFNGTNSNVTSDNSGKIGGTQTCGVFGAAGSVSSNTYSVIAANQGYMNFGIGIAKSTGSTVIGSSTVGSIFVTIPIDGWEN